MLQGLVSSFRDQPKQLFKLCLVEMWERFGFVTTVALTVLFLSSSVADGGLGWSNADALLWLGYYAALLFMMPVVGGWIADKFIGNQAAIQIGGTMMAFGYLGLGVLPYVYLLFGLDITLIGQVAQDAGLPLAQIALGDEVWMKVEESLKSHVGDGVSLNWFQIAYWAQSLLLGVSFLLVALGNALFKPNVTATVGALYRDGDARQDGGFTLFWTFINAGAFLAYIVGGAVGERIGWNFGYLVAFLGMFSGMIYFFRIKRDLPKLKVKPLGAAIEVPKKRLSKKEKRRIWAALTLTFFAIIFNISHMQILGLISLFVQQDVDKTIAGQEIPTLWVTSVNPILILMFAPLAANLWDRLGKRDRNPSFVTKFVMAFALLALGEIILVSAASQPSLALILVIIAIMAMSFAEIPLQPIGLSMMTSLSPQRFVGMMIGAWFLSMAVANAVAGNIGALASNYGLQAVFFWSGISCAVAGLVLYLLRRWLLALMALETPQSLPDEQAAVAEIGGN